MASKSRKLALRYAQALLHAAEREGMVMNAESAMSLREQILTISHAWETSGEFRASLTNPMLPDGKKRELLERAIGVFEIPRLVAQFLRVVFERGRAELLPDIAETFSLLADKRAGILRVEITTARGVDEDEMRVIEGKLRAKLEGTLLFSWREDASILGGIVVRYGGRVLDGSLKRRVTAIERQILG